MLFRAVIPKMLVRIANREDPRLLLQKQYDLGMHCLSRHIWQATNFQNFRKFTCTCTVNVLKFLTLFLFLFFNKMLPFLAEIQKMITGRTLIRNSLMGGLHCLFMPFCQALIVHNFRTFTLSKYLKHEQCFLFGLVFDVPVNSYGHIRKVSSPKTFFPGQT